MSRVGSLENPDYLLIDLDPQECGYEKIVEAALLVRAKLDRIELESYPKTTGGDGMHIFVPLEPRYTYEQVRAFAEVLAMLAPPSGRICSPRRARSRAAKRAKSISTGSRSRRARRFRRPTCCALTQAPRWRRRWPGMR